MSTRLDIISDPICPWCYIGKARLEAALQKAPEGVFDIHWHPFQLNPDMPPQGRDRRDYLESKFGGAQGAAKAYAPVAAAAKDSGLTINLEKITRTPNTLDAHRLIHWAGIEGVQNAAVNALFEANFVQGLDISDHAVLADIAETAGMERGATLALLASDADREDIQARDKQAREMGVGGVPCFIVANKYAVEGVQPAETWASIIAEIDQLVKAQD
ncbi:MAG: DsbA family oxidoreductase [Paracoccaceae bacterium]